MRFFATVTALTLALITPAAAQTVTLDLINEYPATKTYSQWERVGYVQLPHAVAYIVLSSRDHVSYQKDSGALQQVLKTFTYLPMAVAPKSETEKQ